MKLSIHPGIVGKPTKIEREDKGPLYQSKGKIVNLGYGWENIDCSFDDAFELITTDGLATSSELSSDNRKDDNYVSRQLIMVDIDSGMTILELFENDFYNEYGAGFYATASHTDAQHRFRVMFVTEEPINHAELMKKIIRGLLVVFESADISCKDASRLYYGVENCVIKEKTGKVLPLNVIEGLINLIDDMEFREQLQFVQTYNDKARPDETFVDELLSRISMRNGDLRGSYDIWRSIAWATCHAVGIHLAGQLMMKHWPVKTKKEMQTLRSWKNHNKSYTIGTLIKLSGISRTERELLELQIQLRNIK
jgi:hypothetical protein